MRLLFISYHFPPSRAARSLQLGKLVKYLLRRQVALDVVTAGAEAGTPVDAQVGQWLEQPGIQLRPVASPPRSGLDWVAVALRGENFPGWRRNASGEAIRLLSAAGPQAFDAMVSFAFPVDSHLAGLAVKRRFPGLTWIAHWSDPWASNPYVIQGGWRQGLLARTEARICAASDAVVTVSEELTQHFAARHGGDERRFRTLHHVFDPEQYPPSEAPSGGPLVFRYLGGFSERRSPAVLFRSIEAARSHGGDLARMRIELVGEKMDDVARRINEIQPGLASTTGAIPYAESLRLMRASDALLLIDADQDFSPYFPSKLADYFGAGRPILAISPKESCTTRLIREFGGRCWAHHDAEQFGAALAGVLQQGRAALAAPDAARVAAFRADQIAKRFEAIVRDVRR